MSLSALSRASLASGLAPRARPAFAAPIPRVGGGRPGVARAAGADFDPFSSHSSRGGGGGGAGDGGAMADARPLFTLDRASAHDNLTFEDIRDAYEMCSTIPDSHERGQCYSVFNIDGDRMAAYYAPVSRLEDALLGGAARRALAAKAEAANNQQQQQQQQAQAQGQQQSGGRRGEEDVNGPLAFLARLFLGH